MHAAERAMVVEVGGHDPSSEALEPEYVAAWQRYGTMHRPVHLPAVVPVWLHAYAAVVFQEMRSDVEGWDFAEKAE